MSYGAYSVPFFLLIQKKALPGDYEIFDYQHRSDLALNW